MFTLRSVWRPTAPVARVWSVLADPRFTWPDWWPGLTAAATRPVVGPDGLAAAGTWADLRVRSPLGYSLQFRLDLRQTTAPSDGEPGRALLDVSGDLAGSAEVTVRAVGDGGGGSGVSTGSTSGGSTSGGPTSEGSTEVELLWLVSPVPAWFRATSRIAPGPLSWAHAHVMRAGERGLAARLHG
ncbi:hypothetical protein ACQEVI_04815 [Promicromonospora sp. CA-289599]|uniref:hypothetical protein n=1 Tax=Promicromonospora sp. CA-289599 TaxID=3240014 RepID=UPI003D8F7348